MNSDGPLLGAYLSDTEVAKAIDSGELVVHPLLDVQEQIQGAKVDLRLGTKLLLLRPTETPLLEPHRLSSYYDTHIIPLGSRLIIHPREFVLATTFETLRIPDQWLGHLEGRSSLGRLGIVVHATAGLVDPGFVGALTLEITNLGKAAVPLSPLMRIASITFSRIEGKVAIPYGKRRSPKYQHSLTAGASELSGDLENDTITTLIPQPFSEEIEVIAREYQKATKKAAIPHGP